MQQSTSCLLTDRTGSARDGCGQNEVTESDGERDGVSEDINTRTGLRLNVIARHAWETKVGITRREARSITPKRKQQESPLASLASRALGTSGYGTAPCDKV